MEVVMVYFKTFTTVWI